MKYIIIDPDEQTGIELKKILDTYEILDFKGRFRSLEAVEKSMGKEVPDAAFVRVGNAELNAFKLVDVIRKLNQPSKVIFISSDLQYAVDAFEWGVDGFLFIPFNKEKIQHFLLKWLELPMD